VNSEAWLLVGVVGLATIALKASGPILVGAGGLPERLTRLTDLLAPALLAALVATQTFTTDEELVVDERAAGLAAATLMVALRAPILATVVIAAAVAGGLRAV
jgi:branched-subunit amino acid transport protein